MVPGAMYLGGLASKTSWRSLLCNSMPRYHTNVIMAKVPGTVHFGGFGLALPHDYPKKSSWHPPESFQDIESKIFTSI